MIENESEGNNYSVNGTCCKTSYYRMKLSHNALLILQHLSSMYDLEQGFLTLGLRTLGVSVDGNP